MREGLDAFLFTNEEEWLPTMEAILYIEMELGLKFIPVDIIKLSKKHNLCRINNGILEHKAEELKRKVEEVYLFEPPRGYLLVSAIKRKYPKIERVRIHVWIRTGLLPILKIEVGTTEVTYVKESEYRELYGKRTSKFWPYNRKIGKKRKPCKKGKAG